MSRNIESIFGAVVTAPHQIPFTYTATGGEQSISLPFFPLTGFITINGGVQVPVDNYEIDGNTINLGRTLEADDVVYCLFDKIISPEDQNKGVRIYKFQAVGGETQFTPDFTSYGVQALFIDGKYNVPDTDYSYNPQTGKVTLNSALVAGVWVVSEMSTKLPNTTALFNRTVQEVARAANVKDSAVINSTDTISTLDNKTVIFDVVAQKIWGIPSGVPNGAKIVSVSNGSLVYNPGAVSLQLVPVAGSAEELKNKLNSSQGAGNIFTSTGETVQQVLDSNDEDISGIVAKLSDTKTQGVVNRGVNSNLYKRSQRPHRVTNKTVPNDNTLQYDHFGIMDRKADGTLYMSCRRAANHLSEGYVIFSELGANGNWNTRTIIQTPGVDLRGSAGGTAPTGDIVIALVKMQPNSNPNIFLGIEIHISRDDGLTFQKVSDISSPGVAGTVLLPFGKLEVLGDRWVIPCYSTTAYTNNKLQLLESTDNGQTWAIGSTIQAVSGVDANESAVLDCGGGVCICVSRNGSGTVNNDGTHRPLVYRSADGGVTWSPIGEMRGPDWADNDASSEAGTAGGSGWQLVTPQLSLIHSAGGKPYILCTYTCRRSGVRYRTISVDDFTRSNATTTYWSEYNTAVPLMSPVETFESGYQTQFVLDGQLFINVFRVTTADAVSTASLFQVQLPNLPDYDSGWFAVTTRKNYTLVHGLNCIPTNTIIQFSDTDDGRGATFGCSPRLYYNGTTTVGAGIEHQVNLSGYTVRTGDYLTFQGVFGDTVGPNRVTGFVRLMAFK